MQGYSQIVLKDYLSQMGDLEATNLLSEFSCPLNNDVEYFLKHKAIEFEKQSLSTTYLIFASYKTIPVLVGYFVLASKTLTFTKKAISNNMFRKLKRFAIYDPYMLTCTIPVPLIGQLGKNYSHGYNKLISGDELLKLACDKVWSFQRSLSGKYVYLECEDVEKLLDFYSNNGFVQFGKRNVEKDEAAVIKGRYLIQMIKDLKVGSDD